MSETWEPGAGMAYHTVRIHDPARRAARGMPGAHGFGRELKRRVPKDPLPRRLLRELGSGARLRSRAGKTPWRPRLGDARSSDGPRRSRPLSVPPRADPGER